MKILIISIAIFSGSVFAGDLTGEWQGKRYDIDLQDSFNDIEGNWGNVRYDLNVQPSFNDIDGSIDGQRVDIDVQKSFFDVVGTLPCGRVDYSYSVSFKEVSGTLCGQRFEVNLDTAEDVVPTAEALLLDELVRDFPAPVQGAVKRFILSRIKF